MNILRSRKQLLKCWIHLRPIEDLVTVLRLWMANFSMLSCSPGAGFSLFSLLLTVTAAAAAGIAEETVVIAWQLLYYLCCISTYPQTSWLKATHVYYFTISMGQQSGHGQMGACFSLTQGTIVLLAGAVVSFQGLTGEESPVGCW